jgi:hypothetical protein
LRATDRALDMLGEIGFDASYGARPLKRVIQRKLENTLAMSILERRVREGDVVEVDVVDGELDLRTLASENGSDPVTEDIPVDAEAGFADVEDAEYEEL